MKRFLSRRFVGLALLILLALFLVRPQVGLLRRKAADSLSAELGKPVSVGSVHIRFLPRPGLELENLAIHDDGQYGDEPLLRAPDVNAWLRISSLLRGRIEISSLRLSDASVNLSRSAEGKWNIEELVVRASRSSTAPTASGRKEVRREFPYIQADHARINFKNGVEKTRFAFTSAEFALWQESENEWGMRLQARPIRTDANLTDTGVVSINGVWDRSAILENTPVRLSLEWKQAQIGQVSKLFSGVDKGWRGDALLNATFTGTLGKFTIAADASVDQLRRQDTASDGSLRALAHCAAEYDALQRTLENVDCSAPAGDGLLEVKGSVTRVPFDSYDLKLLAKDLPVQSVLNFTRHVNRSVPQDLKAIGSVNMVIAVNRSGPGTAPEFNGAGEALGVRLSSAATGVELPLRVVPLRLSSITAVSHGSGVLAEVSSAGSSPELQLGPISVPLGRSVPVQAQLSLSRAGYRCSIRGEASIKRLLQIAQMLTIPAPQVAADGTAAMNLAAAREWNSPAPAITGSSQLRSVYAQVRGLNLPLQIHRADLALAEDVVRVSNVDAAAGETTWRGSLLLPRPCSVDSCAFQFHLRSPRINALVLNQMLNPAAAKHPWYRLLSLSPSHASFFSSATGNGSIAIDKLTLGKAVCQRFSADLALDKGKISLTNARATFMQGEAAGALKADFTVHPPTYSGVGEFNGVELAAVAKLMQNQWAAGTAMAHYQFTAAGSSIQDLLDSARLKSSFKITDGVFPHVVLVEDGDPLHANAFSGQVSYSRGTFLFDDAELNSSSGIFALSGTASISGALDLKLASENAPSYAISGTLAQTRVSPLVNPATQAALKP